MTIYNDAETGLPDANHAPDQKFWMGTNSIGQDMWARLWAGVRTSLGLGVAVAVLEIFLGGMFGILWGLGRKTEGFFTEIYNIFDNIPQTLVLILLSYILKPGISTMLFALCITGWTEMARIVRNQVVVLRDRDYNVVSRCLGTGFFTMIRHNFLPYIMPLVALRTALTIPGVIGKEVLVTYIGIGLPAETVSLGNLIHEGRVFMGQPSLRYQMLYPLGMLIFLAISLYVVGNAFADKEQGGDV